MSHYLSVIIPVYNDALNLAHCLDALEKQTLDKSRYEIIVVDNGSTDGLQSMLGSRTTVHLVSEHRPGSYSARNKGILSSDGDVLVFTDSDCIPDKDWLEKGLSSLSTKDNIGFVAGNVIFFPKDADNLTGPELWEMLNNYDAEVFVESMHFGLTANLFVPREVFGKVGLFNPELRSAGDYEWGNRVYDKGFSIQYDENVVVMHPARRTISQLINKTRRLTGGQLDVGLVSRSYCLKKILIDIFPPVLTVFRLLKRDDIKSLGRADYKIKFLFVFVVLRYVGVYEMARLLLGGKSIR
jgi:glycosyltransferase involved in cell wall biosynthesis